MGPLGTETLTHNSPRQVTQTILVTSFPYVGSVWLWQTWCRHDKSYTYSCCYTSQSTHDFTSSPGSSWQGRLQIGFVIVGNSVVFLRPQAMLAGCGVRWFTGCLSLEELSLESKVGMCTRWESNYGSNGRHWLACKPTCRFQPNFGLGNQRWR